MSDVSNLSAVDGAGSRKSKSILPSLQRLFTPALLVNGLIVSSLFIERRVVLGLGIAGGCLVGLLTFAALYYFAENALDLFKPNSAPGTVVNTGGQLMLGLFAGGKFIVIGLLMFVLIAILHLSVVAFVIGFLVTQISVSILVIKSLIRSRDTA